MLTQDDNCKEHKAAHQVWSKALEMFKSSAALCAEPEESSVAQWLRQWTRWIWAPVQLSPQWVPAGVTMDIWQNCSGAVERVPLHT